MLFKEKSSDHMVEISNIVDLVNLNCEEVMGSDQAGEEAQDMEKYSKSNLAFLSGEDLPRCWKDPHYRDEEIQR